MNHYHIRWSSLKLDWQVFHNEKDAAVSAEELVRPGETYAIEGFGDDCERCKGAGKVGRLDPART